MADELFLDEGGLDLNDPPRLVWARARDAAGLLWRENPKLHNLQDIVASVRRHSFQVPGKFDARLFRAGQPPEDGEPLGAIKAGNGRYEAVAWLEAHWADVKADEEGVPRGLGVDAEGAWVVPVLVGTDARSTSAAMEFAVDDNNLVLSGGDLDGFDMARLWDAHYVRLLGELDELPVSVDAEVMSMLVAVRDVEDFMRPDFDDLIEEFEEPETGQTHKDEKWFYVGFYGDVERWDELSSLLSEQLVGQSPHELDSDFFYKMVRGYFGEA